MSYNKDLTALVCRVFFDMNPPELKMSQPLSILEDFTRAVVPILLVGVAFAGYWYWGKPSKAEMAEPTVKIAVPVATAAALPFTGAIEIMVDGVAKPHRQISIASEVSGRVKIKNPEFNDGKYLKAGSLLYEIDSADYETAVKRIAEELLQAKNAIKEWAVDHNNTLDQIQFAEQDLGFVVNEAERLRDLRKSNAASATEMDLGRRAEVTARLSVQNLKNQIRVLEARKARTESAVELQQIALVQAKRNLERTKIFAPVDCVVVTDDCEEGSYVQAGKVVAILNDLGKAEVGCQLQLDDLFWLWKVRSPQELIDSSSQRGKVYDIPPVPVVVEFPFHDRLCRWTGVISRLGGTGIDLSTRTIPCVVLVENPMQSTVTQLDGSPVADFLPPPLATGMFVSVRIAVKPTDDLLVVPSTSVRSGGVMWLVRDGKLVVQAVKIARRMQDQVLILGSPNGLQANDRVIVSPLAVAEDGMLLEEQKTE